MRAALLIHAASLLQRASRRRVLSAAGQTAHLVSPHLHNHKRCSLHLLPTFFHLQLTLNLLIHSQYSTLHQCFASSGACARRVLMFTSDLEHLAGALHSVDVLRHRSGAHRVAPDSPLLGVGRARELPAHEHSATARQPPHPSPHSGRERATTENGVRHVLCYA